MPEGVDARFPGGEWLDPLATGVSQALELVDRAKAVLLVAGAKIERYMLKSRLAVLDGAEPDGEVDLSEEEETGGGRA